MESDSQKAGRISLRAVDPVTGKDSEVLISHARMHAVARRSLGHARECGVLVPYALQHPTAVLKDCGSMKTRTNGVWDGIATVRSPLAVTTRMA
jgi:hypothetical protein